MNWTRTFSALRHTNYRLWFAGQLVSLFGSWMQFTAQGYLVFELTRSPAYLGYVSFASGLPACGLLLYGGVVADRVSRRLLLIVTQSAMMVLAFILAAITFSGLVRPWHIIVLAFGLGLANAFDAPARHAFVFELVDRETLTSAIALNSTLFNCALAVGPALAGITYMMFGPALCFTINGLSFTAVIAALALMKLQPAEPVPEEPSALQSLVEGVRYVLFAPIIRTLVGMVGYLCLFGFSCNTLIPAWAVTVLHGDAATNGLLQSARGAGAVISALAVASLGGIQGKGRLLALGLFALPVALVSFATVQWLPLSLAVMVGVGIAQTFNLNLCNVLVQTIVSDKLRGRVMSIYSLTMFGLMPIGGLVIGLLAEYFGEPMAIKAVCAVSFSCAALAWFCAPKIRTLK